MIYAWYNDDSGEVRPIRDKRVFVFLEITPSAVCSCRRRRTDIFNGVYNIFGRNNTSFVVDTEQKVLKFYTYGRMTATTIKYIALKYVIKRI